MATRFESSIESPADANFSDTSRMGHMFGLCGDTRPYRDRGRWRVVALACRIPQRSSLWGADGSGQECRVAVGSDLAAHVSHISSFRFELSCTSLVDRRSSVFTIRLSHLHESRKKYARTPHGAHALSDDMDHDLTKRGGVVSMVSHPHTRVHIHPPPFGAILCNGALIVRRCRATISVPELVL